MHGNRRRALGAGGRPAEDRRDRRSQIDPIFANSELRAAIDTVARRALRGLDAPVAFAVLAPDCRGVWRRGAGPEADYEIGSIAKGVTGLLYAHALEAGEVTRATELGSLLPLGDCPAAGITLGSIAAHRSGLPGLPPAMHPWRAAWRAYRTGANPYGQDLAELVALTRGVHVGAQRPKYSNLGFMLLGHALAAASAAAGGPAGYRALVEQRIARPLGLDPFFVAEEPGDLRAPSLLGHVRHGAPPEAWTGQGLGPAGGIRASIGAMATLASALLAGTAPGMAALDPVESFGVGNRIGAAWLTTAIRGRQITWHNGGTGGFRSWMGLDRAAGVAVVVLAAQPRSMDKVGISLLETAAKAS